MHVGAEEVAPKNRRKGPTQTEDAILDDVVNKITEQLKRLPHVAADGQMAWFLVAREDAHGFTTLTYNTTPKVMKAMAREVAKNQVDSCRTIGGSKH